jgi:hypothetical protein
MDSSLAFSCPFPHHPLYYSKIPPFNLQSPSIVEVSYHIVFALDLFRPLFFPSLSSLCLLYSLFIEPFILATPIIYVWVFFI